MWQSSPGAAATPTALRASRRLIASGLHPPTRISSITTANEAAAAAAGESSSSRGKDGRKKLCEQARWALAHSACDAFSLQECSIASSWCCSRCVLPEIEWEGCVSPVSSSGMTSRAPAAVIVTMQGIPWVGYAACKTVHTLQPVIYCHIWTQLTTALAPTYTPATAACHAGCRPLFGASHRALHTTVHAAAGRHRARGQFTFHPPTPAGLAVMQPTTEPTNTCAPVCRLVCTADVSTVQQPAASAAAPGAPAKLVRFCVDARSSAQAVCMHSSRSRQRGVLRQPWL